VILPSSHQRENVSSKPGFQTQIRILSSKTYFFRVWKKCSEEEKKRNFPFQLLNICRVEAKLPVA